MVFISEGDPIPKGLSLKVGQLAKGSWVTFNLRLWRCQIRYRLRSWAPNLFNIEFVRK